MIDPLFSRFVAAAFALLLLLAAWHKLADRPRFAAALGEYRLLPTPLVPLASWWVPACEILLAGTWLAGGTALAASLTAVLLTVYAAAVAINLLRGRVHIGCGCGFGASRGGDAPLSWWLVLRNLLLAGVALVGLWPAGGRPLGAYDWLSMLLALTATGALFAGSSQLLRNRAAMAVWRKARD